MTNNKTKKMILCAFFAALTVVCSMITIPLPFSPVPINLAVFAVLCAGVLLGPKTGTLSQIVYVLLGLVGLPVFANFQGGPGVLAGPTGGYIVGYIVAAFLAGFLSKGSNFNIPRITGALVVALLACYTLGTLWFIFVTKTPLMAALGMCVIPFLPGDALKIIAAVLLSKKLRPVLSRFQG